MRIDGKDYRTVWLEGDRVRLIDQRKLPHRFEVFDAPDHTVTAWAIREMVVRGAPAIGATAAFGLYQVYREAPEAGPGRAEYLRAGFDLLRSTRPTAQNLFWALDRVRHAAEQAGGAPAEAARVAALSIADEDAANCERIGEAGAALIEDGATVLTHCNAGWLATVDWGTALAPIYKAHRAGRRVRVLANETRPRCQGSNLTAWELHQEGVPVQVIADNAAGLLMMRGEVSVVLTGADRIAANGDAANKIGTYEKALLAREHGIPFYIAAPVSTFDPECADGMSIPIEERSQDEVLYAHGALDGGELARVRIAPSGVGARNPAFDITPARLIRGIITEYGIIEASNEGIARLLGLARSRSARGH